MKFLRHIFRREEQNRDTTRSNALLSSSPRIKPFINTLPGVRSRGITEAAAPTTVWSYDVPEWKEVTVYPDHHVSFGQALYSTPTTTCPPGTTLEAAVTGR